MTMWTSAEAINAEIEYRREQNTRTASIARVGRQLRAGRSERRRSRRAESGRGSGALTPDGAGECAPQRRETSLPAQRTSGSSQATKQAV